jgi:hypothetical protein
MDEGTRRLQIAALRRYCEFDRSDPYSYDRGMCHIANGLTAPCVKSEMRWAWREGGRSTGVELGPPIGTPGHYDAHREPWGWSNVARL